MEILDCTEASIARAAAVLVGGGIVAFPTETVYGLGADALNPLALARVFAAKRRPHFDPLIVHVSSIDMVDRLARLPSGPGLRLMEELWPGPLTLVLPKRDIVPDLATSGLPTVAIRMPDHPVARRLIELSTGAVAAPSANPFGRLSPTLAIHVVEGLGEAVDIVIDGGACPIGVESTVLDLSGDRPLVLRPGGMAMERIKAIMDDVELFDRKVATPTSPGQLPSHYAPRTRLHLVPAGGLASVHPGPKAAALCFDKASVEALESGGVFERVMYLTEGMDVNRAAAALFQALHKLDKGDYATIWAEAAPQVGLGRAINDRLYKASVRP